MKHCLSCVDAPNRPRCHMNKNNCRNSLELTPKDFECRVAGADGVATPQYAAYGATKAGIAQVMGSIAAECREKDIHVGVHTLSPGMVLTQLILDGATNRNKQVQPLLTHIWSSKISPHNSDFFCLINCNKQAHPPKDSHPVHVSRCQDRWAPV